VLDRIKNRVVPICCGIVNRRLIWLAGAGTADRISISLHGAREAVTELSLQSSADAFEAGKCDIFEEMLPDLGTLQHIEVRRDGRSPQSGWHLERVHIVACGSGPADQPEEYYFHYKCGQACIRYATSQRD
jgi:PLAT/LH2 domain